MSENVYFVGNPSNVFRAHTKANGALKGAPFQTKVSQICEEKLSCKMLGNKEIIIEIGSVY